jgi:hypothetical protein
MLSAFRTIVLARAYAAPYSRAQDPGWRQGSPTPCGVPARPQAACASCCAGHRLSLSVAKASSRTVRIPKDWQRRYSGHGGNRSSWIWLISSSCYIHTQHLDWCTTRCYFQVRTYIATDRQQELSTKEAPLRPLGPDKHAKRLSSRMTGPDCDDRPSQRICHDNRLLQRWYWGQRGRTEPFRRHARLSSWCPVAGSLASPSHPVRTKRLFTAECPSIHAVHHSNCGTIQISLDCRWYLPCQCHKEQGI